MRTAARPATPPLRPTRLATAIAAMTSGLLATGAWAAPVIGHGGVTSGNATIAQQGAVTNIHQSSHKASINWQSFSTTPTETVNFHQPNAASVTLNRVIGNEASVLQGALNANGQVFLLNSNGVLIGKGASINTAGFVASTLGLSDADFQNGHYRFDANGHHSGSLVNLGTITVADKGYAALLGQTVKNEGVIVARQGTVSLASGNRITLNFNGDSLVNVTLDQGALNALVENKHAIIADGGQILLTAKAATALLESQVNNTGILQAQTLADVTGKIELYAHGGTTTVNGTLDASAPGAGNSTGNGGFIETSGDIVKIADTANITTLAQNGQTGTWLIDPVDFTIAATGGDITGTALSNRLASNHVTIQSVTGSKQGKGDIIVNDQVSWNANTTLALEAENDIHINNAITIGGEKGQLVMTTGANGDYHIRTKASYSGAVLDANGRPVAKQDTSGGVYGSVTFTNTNNKDGLVINGTDYTLLHSMQELADISGIKGHYALANNLEGGTHTKAVVDVLEEGVFTGLGHVVRDLTINAPTLENVGLIGASKENTFIRDLGVLNASITGRERVGALLGRNASNLDHVYSSGSITARQTAGGLFGAQVSRLRGGNNLVHIAIHNSFSTADIHDATQSGGISGWNRNITVSNVHATGNIIQPSESGSNLGGLLGYAGEADVSYSYATGDVTAGIRTDGMGGLIGAAAVSRVDNSFASGNIIGGYSLGGLIGSISPRAAGFIVFNSHASGNVTGLPPNRLAIQGIGGLIGNTSTVGQNPTTTVIIENSSATGNVTSNGNLGFLGGLVGSMRGGHKGNSAIINSWATGDVTSPVLAGITPLDDVGGLAGLMTNASIIGSYASGNVSGGSRVGGLVGSASVGAGGIQSIENSYATGTVSNARWSGGLVGQSYVAVTSSYWRKQEDQDGFGLMRATVNNSQGLDASQLSDVRFYANGTIDAVLAERAASAALLQSRVNASGQQMNLLIQTQQAENQISFLDSWDFTSAAPALNNQITMVDSREFFADVSTIDASGEKFYVTPID